MKIAVRAASYMVVSGMLAAGSIGACNGDDNSGLSGSGGGNGDSGTTSSSPDAGAQSSDTGTGTSPGLDASQGADTSVASDSGSGLDSSSPGDASKTTDAGSDAGSNASDASDGSTADAAPQTFCAGQTGLDFCEDFDDANPLSLDAGAPDYWTALVGTTAEVAVSSAQYSSAPNSLLVQLADGPANTDQSAKVVKMITPASGVTQAIYEFDMYIASVPLFNTGGFATDFQFDDVGTATDQFGFRIGVFSNTTGFDHADLEHNHPVLGGNDDITSPNPDHLRSVEPREDGRRLLRARRRRR